MTKNKNNKLIRYVKPLTGVVISVLVIAAVMISFVIIIDKQVRNTQIENISEIAEHDMQSVNSNFQDMWAELSETSDRIKSNNINSEEELNEFIKSEIGYICFENVYAVYEDYSVNSSDVTKINDSLKKSIVQSSQFVSDKLFDKASRETLYFGISDNYELNNEKKIIAYIGEMRISQIQAKLKLSSFKESVYNTVLNADGYPIFMATEYSSNNISFWDELENGTLNGVGLKEIKEGIAAGNSIVTNFIDASEVEYTLIFEPISIQGWSLVMKVPDSVMTWQSSLISLITLTMVMLSLATILFFSIRTMLASQKAKAQELELENEAIRRKDLEVIASQKETLQNQQVLLKKALAETQKANEAKSTFLFNISHDIRTPISVILGFTDLAKKNIDNKLKINDCISKIELSGNHLLTLINDILDMSRVENGKELISNKPADIMNCAQEILPMLEQMAAQKQIEFNSIIKDVQNRYINCDYYHMNRCIMNIVSNAVKYTDKSGNIDFVVTQVGTFEKDGKQFGNYSFVVKDDGIGMNKDFVDKVFDAFTRERTSTVSGMQGTGLGMAITKNLVEMMNGKIYVESEIGKGSQFTIIIPFEIISEEVYNATVKDRKTDDEFVQNSISGKTILLVEDNELNREIAAEILTDEGANVIEAENGEIAVEKVIEKKPDYFDFILMDIQMPIMNGYEATAKIRELYPHNDIKIIALSANAFEEDAQKSIDMGMNGHLAKPININQLKELI